jgi:deazaflavin-dependent oxidoreductase (nitroreductase family)
MNELNSLLSGLTKEEYCYLTTTGRVTGKPHKIEIWFGLHNATLYLMAGDGKSDWVKNLLKNPSVTVRIAKHIFSGTARPVIENEQEQMLARHMIADKYKEREADGLLSEWAQTAVVVGIDLNSSETL